MEFYTVLCHVEAEVEEIRHRLATIEDVRGAAVLELAVQTLDRVRRGKEIKDTA